MTTAYYELSDWKDATVTFRLLGGFLRVGTVKEVNAEADAIWLFVEYLRFDAAGRLSPATKWLTHKDIWEIVRPDEHGYDYPAQIIRYTENQRNELNGEIAALRCALVTIRENLPFLGDREGIDYFTDEAEQALKVLDKEYPAQYYIDLKAQKV